MQIETSILSAQNLKHTSHKQEISFFLSSEMKITKRLIILKKFFSQNVATKTQGFVCED